MTLRWHTCRHVHQKSVPVIICSTDVFPHGTPCNLVLQAFQLSNYIPSGGLTLPAAAQPVAAAAREATPAADATTASRTAAPAPTIMPSPRPAGKAFDGNATASAASTTDSCLQPWQPDDKNSSTDDQEESGNAADATAAKKPQAKKPAKGSGCKPTAQPPDPEEGADPPAPEGRKGKTSTKRDAEGKKEKEKRTKQKDKDTTTKKRNPKKDKKDKKDKSKTMAAAVAGTANEPTTDATAAGKFPWTWEYVPPQLLPLDKVLQKVKAGTQSSWQFLNTAEKGMTLSVNLRKQNFWVYGGDGSRRRNFTWKALGGPTMALTELVKIWPEFQELPCLFLFRVLCFSCLLVSIGNELPTRTYSQEALPHYWTCLQASWKMACVGRAPFQCLCLCVHQ